LRYCINTWINDRKNTKKRSLAGAFCASDQLLAEAVAAVDRTVGAGLERNLAGLAAACAGCIVHLTVAAATGRALLASRTAGLAALGFIGETLLGVEFLLAGGEGEAGSAIFADDGFVAEHGNTSFVFCWFWFWCTRSITFIFREWLHPCLGWRLEALEETKKDRLFSRDQDALDPINLPFDFRQCALIKKHMRPIIK
jgi:hypothetical protein